MENMVSVDVEEDEFDEPDDIDFDDMLDEE